MSNEEAVTTVWQWLASADFQWTLIIVGLATIGVVRVITEFGD